MDFLNFFLLTLIQITLWCVISADLKGYDDSLLFSINWPGRDALQELQPSSQLQEITVKTENGETYKCTIPQILEKVKDHQDKYSGPNGLDLLAPLFSQSTCSYRLEAYWTYEICHGKYVRQYHEEREGKKIEVQEYFLGRWDDIQLDALWRQIDQEESMKPSLVLPVKKIDGLSVPYLQVNMTDGTVCDLNAKPRQTRVLYVCYPLGKHEIYSLKETSICEYEVIVLSPLLCAHPRYMPQESRESAINCYPLDVTSGNKPKNLLQFEAESLKMRHQKPPDDGNIYAVFSVEKTAAQDGIRRVHIELLPPQFGTTSSAEEPVSSTVSPQTPSFDINKYNEFLSGRDCVEGGSGWWKYRFCYGQSVTQYHLEKDGSKTVVNLGNFIKAGHLKWLDANPHKRPVKGSHLHYFYTKGTVCEETGQHRQTEGKSSAVTVYLLEPKTCQYILGVESHMFCHLSNHVDENAFVQDGSGEQIGFSRADYGSGYTPQEENRDKNSDGNVPGGGE